MYVFLKEISVDSACADYTIQIIPFRRENNPLPNFLHVAVFYIRGNKTKF